MVRLRSGSFAVVFICLVGLLGCDADRASEEGAGGFLAQAEAALDGGGVVQLESNVLKGTVRLTNANPEVLGMLATDIWRLNSGTVTLVSTAPLNVNASTGSVVSISPSEYRFELLVEAGARGELGVVYTVNATRGHYSFPSLPGVTVRPVSVQPAPTEIAIQSCIGVVEYRFGTDVTCQTPAPVESASVSVEGLTLHSPSPGLYRSYITGGTNRSASIVYHSNTPTGPVAGSFPVQVAAGCDEVVRTCVPVGTPAPPAVGNATGAFEIHGETSIYKKSVSFTGVGTRVQDLPGPWSPASQPESWWTVPNLPVGTYTVDALAYLRTGRRFTVYDAPNLPGTVSVSEGQTTPLTQQVGGVTRHAYDMHPAYFYGAVRLVDPYVRQHPGAWSSLQALFFESDVDTNGDGVPDYLSIADRSTRLGAGTVGGFSYTAFPGTFNASQGELVSDYEQVLPAPYDLPTTWTQGSIFLSFWSEPANSGPFTTRPGLYDPARFRSGLLTLRPGAASAYIATLNPGQRFRIDHEYCFNEVQVQYAPSQGRIYNPRAVVMGGLFGGKDWRGQTMSYTIGASFYGTPAVSGPGINPALYAESQGQVSLTLPQGTFNLIPIANLVSDSGAINSATFSTIGLTLGCGQRLKLVPPLAISLSSLGGCATSDSKQVSGQVKSQPAQVDRIWYRLNGGPEVTLCTNCGTDPTFSFNVSLQACDNSIQVFAHTEGMSEPASVIEQLVWDDVSDGPSCPGSFCVNRPPVARCRSVDVPANGTCGGWASVNDGSYDPDTGDTVSCVQTPSSVFPLGSHPATLTCTDSAGLSSSCAATVTVRDETPPTITCPAPIVVERTGPDGATVTPGVATASDTCAPPQVTGPVAGTYPVGTTTVTYTAKDAAGNQASCTSTIQVTDIQFTDPPDVTMCNLPRYTRETTLMACGWTTPQPDTAPVAHASFRVDGGAPIPVTPDLSGGFVLTWLPLTEGTHVVELTAIDTRGATSRKQMTVTVDLTPPVLALLSPLPDASLTSPVVTVKSYVQDATSTTVTTQWLERSTVESGTGQVSHTVDLINRGFVPLLVTATDAAGNTTQLVTQVFIEPASLTR
ncbi:MAG: HYR domain-containing protein [Myxococcaceae bacterium]|nr:MAG: HYR domain-containing protein [Myxococcaceae bacterium]